MELSEDKTLITHSSKCARFLGYDVRVRRSGKIKRGGPGHVKMRTLNGGVELLVPLNDKIRQFVFTKGVAIQKKDGSMFPVHEAYRRAKDKDAYRAKQESSLILHEAAAKALKTAGVSKLPNVAALQVDYEKLREQKEALYADYGKLKKQVKEYDVIKQNIDSILRQPREPEREKGKERGE